MKYRVVIRAFTLRRDIAASRILAELLRGRGCEVAICCVRNFDFFLKEWKPHAVIINTVGKVEQARQCAPGAKIIHWPGEGGEAYENSDSAILKEQGNFNDIDLLLLWGEITKSFFEKDFPGNDSKIKVCGNPRLDILKYMPEKEKKDNTVGILGRFNSINHFDKRPTISSLANNYDNLEGIMVMCRQFVTVCEVIDFIIKETGLKISIRPHPLEAPEGYEKIQKKYGKRLLIDDSFSFAHWAANQKFILAPASTTFMETYLLGIPVINIDGIIDAREKVREQNEITALAYEMSENPTNMKSLFDIILSDPGHVRKQSEILDRHLLEFHNFPAEGSAMKKATDEIMNLLENSTFKKTLHKPKFILDAKDWIRFLRVEFLSGTNHSNFNYKNGYHKFPAYYAEIVENIINGEPVFKH